MTAFVIVFWYFLIIGLIIGLGYLPNKIFSGPKSYPTEQAVYGLIFACLVVCCISMLSSGIAIPIWVYFLLGSAYAGKYYSSLHKEKNDR